MDGRRPASPPVVTKLDGVVPYRDVAPYDQIGPDQMGGAGQQEPHRVGQHHGRRRRARYAIPASAGRTPVRQLVGSVPSRPGHEHHHTDHDSQRGDDQDLGADEELDDDQAGQGQAVAPRRTTLGDQQVGQDQDDQRWDGQEGDVELVEGQLGHHEGREPVGEATEEGGRRPAHPPAQQDEHGQGGEGRGQGQGRRSSTPPAPTAR